MNSNYPRPDHGQALRPPQSTSRVVVVGAGASGTLMALHLAAFGQIEIVLVDKSPRPGRGLAYGTDCAEHVVNVEPGRLSAFSDDPTHFRRWLERRGRLAPGNASAFVPRHLVGEYFGQMLDNAGPNLTVMHDEVTALNETAAGVEVSLESGTQIRADAAILATGHDWIHRSPGPSGVPSDAPVTILGTGLSMVDRWLSLRSSGHRGPVTAISRRGLVPHRHAPCPHLALDPDTVPLGRPVSEVLRWARELAAGQSDWRTAVDAIRPFAHLLWQGWSVEERARFLRHARPYWDIHRHRLAPLVHDRIVRDLETGNLVIQRSRAPVPATPYVFDCRGLRPAWDEIGANLIGHLLRWGDARPDPLGIGLDVTENCNLIAASGQVSDRLYAIGPLTRGRFWEIEAIPEIRAQCSELAGRLARELAGSSAASQKRTYAAL